MTAFVMESTRITLSRMGVSAAFVVLVATSFTLPTMVQEAYIAAINSERILRDPQPAKAVQVKLGTEFAKRGRELQDTVAELKGMSDKLDKDSAVLADPDRNHRWHKLSDLGCDFQRKQRELREGLNQRCNEELAQVFGCANRVIHSIVEQHKHDLIVQGAVYVNPRIDTMDEMLKVLNS